MIIMGPTLPRQWQRVFPEICPPGQTRVVAETRTGRPAAASTIRRFWNLACRLTLARSGNAVPRQRDALEDGRLP